MTKVLVYHSWYGCDTGCCGHAVRFEDASEDDRHFAFEHPYGDDPIEFAKQLVANELGEEHVKDLDWEQCLILDE